MLSLVRLFGLLGLGGLLLMVAMGCGPSEEECLRDIDCASGNGGWSAEAEVQCAPKIEARALYTSRWTEGFFDSKFERVALQPPDYETVKYSGNKVEFQNAFGAWVRQGYDCIYNPVDEYVWDVIIR